MGVTIHFEGRLKDETAYSSVISIAEKHAATHGWPAAHFSIAKAALSRVKDEGDWDYLGPTKGIELQPHPNCEPFRLEFDESLYIQEYTKTQFAPVQVHIDVAALLSAIAPHFSEISVYDEGEFYESGDELQLRRHIDHCNAALEEHLAQDRSLTGPVRLPSGRIADLVSDD